MFRRTVPTCVCLVAAAVLLGLTFSGRMFSSAQEKKKPDPAAVKRAEKMVKMLDDVYKTTIVMVTSKYVKEENDYPAGRLAVRLFETISKKGYHNVQLLDVSGKPYNPKNVADDPFEKTAVKKLKKGAKYYEKIVYKDGKPYLRAMTYVPVVLDKCVLCHPHYKNAKKGAAIGAISYTIPIE